MTTGSLQPPRRPSVRAITEPPIATTPSTPPAGSNRRTDSSGVGASGGTERATIIAETISSGSASANTHRQPSESTRTPPRNGPPAVVIAEPLAHKPIGAATLVLGEAGIDERQADRRHAGGSDALDHATGDEHAEVRRHETDHRAGDEHRATRHVDAPASEHVAGGSADEDQGGHGDEVAVDDPLQSGQTDVEIVTDRRERDVDDRRVEERRRRPEDEPDDERPARRRRELQLCPIARVRFVPWSDDVHVRTVANATVALPDVARRLPGRWTVSEW